MGGHRESVPVIENISVIFTHTDCFEFTDNSQDSCANMATNPLMLPERFQSLLSFSEGGFTLGQVPAFFVRVWNPGFVDPGAPAFFNHKISSSKRHPLLSCACSQ